MKSNLIFVNSIVSVHPNMRIVVCNEKHAKVYPSPARDKKKVKVGEVVYYWNGKPDNKPHKVTDIFDAGGGEWYIMLEGASRGIKAFDLVHNKPVDPELVKKWEMMVKTRSKAYLDKDGSISIYDIYRKEFKNIAKTGNKVAALKLREDTIKRLDDWYKKYQKLFEKQIKLCEEIDNPSVTTNPTSYFRISAEQAAKDYQKVRKNIMDFRLKGFSAD